MFGDLYRLTSSNTICHEPRFHLNPEVYVFNISDKPACRQQQQQTTTQQFRTNTAVSHVFHKIASPIATPTQTHTGLTHCFDVY